MTGAVLSIEDNDDNIVVLQRIFTRRGGPELLIARTGRDGLRLANDAQPVLILLDRRLPDVPGEEVLRQLKESPVTAPIPVIVLSGDSGREMVDEFLGNGASAFIAKPFILREFLAVIDRFCG